MADDNVSQVQRLVEEYGTMLYQVALVNLCHRFDAEDAVQETYLRYCRKRPSFDSAEHERAWLIRVCINICRDMQRARLRHPHVSVENLQVIYEETESLEEDGEVLRRLLSLPAKYKTVLLLHYVRELSVKEIAAMLSLSEAAVHKRLWRAREKLKLEWQEERGKNV